MSDSHDSSPAEPTNADLMAFMKLGFAQLTTAIATTNAKIDEGVGQLRADVAELKVEFGLLEARVDDAHRAILRHANDPNAHPDAA